MPLLFAYELLQVGLISWRSEIEYVTFFVPCCVVINVGILLIAKKIPKLSVLVPFLCLIPFISHFIASKLYELELSASGVLEGWMYSLCALLFISRYYIWYLQVLEFGILIASVAVSVSVTSMDFACYLSISLAAVSYAIFCYFREKKSRRNFMANQESNKQLLQYSLLVNELIPHGIAILSQSLEKIKFTNDSLISKFNGDTSLLLTKLQETFSGEPVSSSPYKASTLIHSHEEREELKLWHILLVSDLGSKIYEIKRTPIVWEEQSAFLVMFTDIPGSFAMSNVQDLDQRHKETEAIASVSHEIRAPINSIMSALEVASAKTTEPEAKSQIKIAKNSANFLLSIVNSFLDMGQIRNDKLSLNISEENIFSIIEEIKEMIEFQTKSKGINFILECPEEMPSYLYTDGDRLKQILINLLSNAVKFTREGSITMGAHWEESIPEIFEFYVKDTGIGIKEEDQIKLFKAYGRLEGESRKELNKKGVGLGLLISANLAILLGPENTEGIEIKSVYQKGSTFSFKIIDQRWKTNIAGRTMVGSSEAIGIEIRGKKIIDEEIKGHSQKPARLFAKRTIQVPDKESFRGKTVLIVEDNPFNILAIKNILNDLEIHTIEAYNGEDAIKKLEHVVNSRSKIDLIFMDCFMPVMNGFEAATYIRDSMSRQIFPFVPIIGLTADTRQDSKIKCLESGMMDVVIKPAPKEAIISIISKWCTPKSYH